MPLFEVETGSGSQTSNSYSSVADADTYQDNHAQSSVWTTASQSAKEKALRLATQYIDTYYAGRFAGSRTFWRQALAFPRSNIVIDGQPLDSNVIPKPLKDAVAEMALRSLSGETLIPDLAAGAAPVKSESKSVGPLSKSVTYETAKREIKKYSIVEGLLADLVWRVGRIERA